MNAVTRRLLKELKDYQKEDHPDLINLSPTQDDNLLIWQAVLRGENETPYQGGSWTLRIEIPKSYPIQPPNVKFMTKICHPNINFKTGEICLDILKNAWSPAWTLQSACMAIRLLLSNPEPNSPLNCDAANLLRCGDLLGYESLVRMYTELYASGQDIEEYY
ncbi:5987_t:CDS:2 [Entrophospora sp. SA101]|nr:4084_t:CDS:2 [Entrophospora candida]CAG8575125.1 2647_t:CDS:2 [Entrophospora candida]CAH1766582.1 10035_t:CDS:2 [Entrophospora sp. SA101]CAJ0825993.1 5987_t:CDS:2 [Entrophospora sp. SA101]